MVLLSVFRKRRLLLSSAAGLIFISSSIAQSQNYPEKPIRLLVPYGTGSSTDQLARIIAEAVTGETKQAVVVEDKPGAEGFIGVQAAATSPADGYTILITTNSTQVVNQHLYKKLPYDPIKDFIPVRTLGQSALGMTVNATSPYRTVTSFVEAARKQPGKFTYGSATATTRLAAELFQQQAGIQLLNVPYRANSLTLNALMGGEIDVMFSDTALVIPHAKSGGKLRTIGVTGLQRMAALPEVPTLKESGISDYYLTFWYGAWVPANTPAAIVTRINDLLGRGMKSSSAQSFLSLGGSDPFDLSGDAFATFQLSEIAKFGRIVKGANITPQ